MFGLTVIPNPANAVLSITSTIPHIYEVSLSQFTFHASSFSGLYFSKKDFIFPDNPSFGPSIAHKSLLCFQLTAKV
eukprot:m.11374 g.11374  ORF g.11374 m.11374 type:complete len:76 (-) comp6888_c1_seq1:134-361(-)